MISYDDFSNDVATMWLNKGGDVDGFEYLIPKIRARVAKLHKKRESNKAGIVVFDNIVFNHRSTTMGGSLGISVERINELEKWLRDMKEQEGPGNSSWQLQRTLDRGRTDAEKVYLVYNLRHGV